MFHVDPATVAPSPAPAAAPAGDALAPATDPRALIDQQIAALTRLAEIGMAIAEAAGRAATDPAAEEAAGDTFHGDPCLAYTRVARAVRLTFALQTQLLKDLAALEAGEAAATSARRKRVRDVVDRGVADNYAEGQWRESGRERGYARERLTEAEDDADLLGLPLPQAVARICADLQLSAEWTARAVAAAQDQGPAARGNVLDPADDRSPQDPDRNPHRARPAHEEGGAGGADQPPRRQGPAPPAPDGGGRLPPGHEEVTART